MTPSLATIDARLDTIHDGSVGDLTLDQVMAATGLSIDGVTAVWRALGRTEVSAATALGDTDLRLLELTPSKPSCSRCGATSFASNLAARLVQLARPNTALIDAVLAGQLDAYPEFAIGPMRARELRHCGTHQVHTLRRPRPTDRRPLGPPPRDETQP